MAVRSFPYWIACLIVVAGCTGEIGRDGADDPAADRQDEVLRSIPNEPHAAVCSGAKINCKARIRTDSTTGNIKAFVTPSGFGPADLVSAYKLNTSVNPGATIAVVDAYHYPTAESDLATYRAQYGLPPCTVASGCLKIVNSSGAASPLPTQTDPTGWAVEAALDLDMASAACPSCKLILVEATDPNGNDLFVAQQGAKTAGATVISDSWGGPETASDPSTNYEQYFNISGVGIFVSSGDAGYDDGGQGPDYPATSAFVTAVGGTSLAKSSSSRGWTEGAWSSGGSACSLSVAKPSFQTSSACNKRASSDVSAVADPNTGLAVYNKAAGGWIVVGGTSASSPFIAGVMALTGHATAGPGYAYAHASQYFDVTTGKNGSCGTVVCNAGAGWDGPTGMGSPNGAALAGGTTCTPQCTGKTCGSDGCGGTCGTCGTGQTCTSAGTCQSGCTPSCTGKTCGSDGCGGTCGTCTTGETCSSGGTCVGGGGTCSHPICSTGGSLTGSCDACAGEICSVDSYCCTTAWDSICVSEVASVCNESCSTGGGGGGGTCAHGLCSAGKKLTQSCDPCATQICTDDPYCCAIKWDSQCVSEVSSICGEACN
jgi:hypothetical protein